MRTRRRLPEPVREFGFTVQTFNLYGETTTDGERLAREQAERAEREAARRQALNLHPQLFNPKPQDP